jgi:hypothetical protein
VDKGGKNVPALKQSDHDTFSTLKRKTAMLEALTQSLGIVAPAANAVGINRNTHYNWMKDDPGYREEVEMINEICFDFVESKMLEKIKNGDTVMAIWYSKTKMKHRGFVERTEVEVTNQPAFVTKPEDKGVNKVMDVIHKKTGTNDK